MNRTRVESDTVVVGGGFYGCSLAEHLARVQGERVVILEAGATLFGRASYTNQARIHRGYHYPRSLLTGLRSSLNFPRFVEEYADCVVQDFHKYYAIARRGSHVTAEQFVRFCQRIGAPVEAAPPEVTALFDRRLIGGVFRVEEFAFDAEKIRKRMLERLVDAGVEVQLSHPVRRLRSVAGGVEVLAGDVDAPHAFLTRRVFTCAYARTNQLLVAAGLAPVPLKHEIAEIALVSLPAPLATMGITVMCGPFFSTMPFPPRALHSLTHVRYTPHRAWHDTHGEDLRDPDAMLACDAKQSHVGHMLRDAARYLPSIADATYVESLWDVKTVLPRSETDDSRPILVHRDPALPALSCIIGAKLDNIYDVIDEIQLSSSREDA